MLSSIRNIAIIKTTIIFSAVAKSWKEFNKRWNAPIQTLTYLFYLMTRKNLLPKENLNFVALSELEAQTGVAINALVVLRRV